MDPGAQPLPRLMRVGVLQFAPVRKDKKANFKKISGLCEGKRLDLVVLPELCTTGYLFASRAELRGLAESFPGGETSDFLKQLAGLIKGHVVAGVAEKDARALYNSAVLFGPEGEIGSYRKVHLFYKEKELFTPGNLGFPLFGIDDVRVGMMVCFDWIYPESARSLALGGADIICHPANLVLPYCPQAASTRALENHVFYLLSDRIGTERLGEDELSFIGKSRIIGIKGEVLASLEEEEALIVAEIEPCAARDKNITPTNDLLRDRRPESYRF